MGFEGTGARLYWKEIANMLPDDSAFTGRSHQGAPDAVNAAINYGYGILTSHVWGAVMNAGLEPFAGFFTSIAPASPRSSSTSIEEFRQPVVDRRHLLLAEQGRPTQPRKRPARWPLPRSCRHPCTAATQRN